MDVEMDLIGDAMPIVRYGPKNTLTVVALVRIRNERFTNRKESSKAAIARKFKVSRAAVGQFMKRHDIL